MDEIRYDRGLTRKVDGLLCRNCHKRIPWGKLTTEYKIENDMFRYWICVCGQTLREDNLSTLQAAQEIGL